MLVVSRKRDESILVRNDCGETIRITVTSFSRDRVRLGIEAPRHWNVVREELLTRQDADTDAATTADGA